MPLINVITSAQPLVQDQARALLKKLSALLARQLRKPEGYVMTSLAARAEMTMAGSLDPSCYVEIKSIGGLSSAVNQALSKEVCATLSEALGVAQDRIYIVFSDIPASAWGNDGSTFG